MTKVWNSEDGSPLRRYSPRGPPYHISQDRYLHITQPDGPRHSARGYNLSVHDSQQSSQDSEQDVKSSRRRIPVACGRCRKRKIRCSGPQGDNGCLNCKNAGNPDCQFNRVQSEEIHLKSSIDFGYNTELARAVHCRGDSQAGPYRPQTPSYTCGPSLMPLNFSLSYRTHPTSDYQYQSKTGCYLPSFTGDYNDDSLDYTLPGSTYPLYGSENLGVSTNYSSNGTNRVWIPGTQSARSPANGVYFDSDAAAYGPHQLQYNGQAFAFRTSVSSEPNHFSFSSMASSLPTPSPVIGNDRVLPIPPRINSMLAPLQRPVDDLSYGGNTMKTTSGQNLAAGQVVTGGHPTCLSYVPHSGNTDPSGSYTTNGLAGSLGQQPPDLYSSSDNWASAALTTDPALRTHEPSPDLYYSHGSDNSRKASQDSQSTISCSLSNSHLYQVPCHQEKPQVPRSGSMDMSHGTTHRPSNGSLRTA